LTASNVDFDFTGGATTSTGITSSACDQVPVVYSDIGNGTITGPTGTTPGVISGLPSTAPFGLNGVAVAYKSNSAVFLKGVASASGVTVNNFITTSFTDTWSSYTRIAP